MLATSPRVSLFRNAYPTFFRAPLARKSCAVVKAVQSTPNFKTTLESLVQPISLTTISSLALALPAHAEAGKLFDFNLTLPIMAIQFLLLMVFLDKTWFSPVGELLDRRDQVIRDQLSSVSSRGDEIAKLEKEAEELLKKARMEAQASINKSRAENEAKNAVIYDDAKAKSDAEIAAAFSNFEKERDAALKTLEAQVDALADQIVLTVLPQGVEA